MRISDLILSSFLSSYREMLSQSKAGLCTTHCSIPVHPPCLTKLLIHGPLPTNWIDALTTPSTLQDRCIDHLPQSTPPLPPLPHHPFGPLAFSQNGRRETSRNDVSRLTGCLDDDSSGPKESDSHRGRSVVCSRDLRGLALKKYLNGAGEGDQHQESRGVHASSFST